MSRKLRVGEISNTRLLGVTLALAIIGVWMSSLYTTSVHVSIPSHFAYGCSALGVLIVAHGWPEVFENSYSYNDQQCHRRPEYYWSPFAKDLALYAVIAFSGLAIANRFTRSRVLASRI